MSIHWQSSKKFIILKFISETRKRVFLQSTLPNRVFGLGLFEKKKPETKVEYIEDAKRRNSYITALIYLKRTYQAYKDMYRHNPSISLDFLLQHCHSRIFSKLPLRSHCLRDKKKPCVLERLSSYSDA